MHLTGGSQGAAGRVHHSIMLFSTTIVETKGVGWLALEGKIPELRPPRIDLVMICASPTVSEHSYDPVMGRQITGHLPPDAGLSSKGGPCEKDISLGRLYSWISQRGNACQ